MVIFHHIPKTAGTSFVALLQRNYTDEELFLSHADKAQPAVWWREWYRSLSDERRRQIKCVASHTANRLIPVLLEDGTPFHALTLLREPVDRCISLYYFVLELARSGNQEAGGRAGQLLLETGWSLDELYHRADEPGFAERNDFLNGFFDAQARALGRPFAISLGYSRQAPNDEARAQIESAMKHYDVGLLEDYNHTIDRWAAAFSWRHVEYEAINVTRSRKGAPPVSPETRALIRSYNQIDSWLHESYLHKR
jgi:hypothetical protein